MPTKLDRNKVRSHLEKFNLRTLFIEELGWDHGGADTVIEVGERSFALNAVAHKRGMVAYEYVANSEKTFPDHSTRRKIEQPSPERFENTSSFMLRTTGRNNPGNG